MNDTKIEKSGIRSMDALLKEKLSTISDIITVKYTQVPHLGVLSGLSGLALFQFYYSKFIDKDDYADIGLTMLTQCIDRINNGYTMPTYCTGIAGMGWLLEHLKEYHFIEVDTDDRLAELDSYLYALMVDNLSHKGYDFLHGGIGYGYYFLKRYKNTTTSTLKQRYKHYLLTSIKYLKDCAEIEGNTFKWESIAQESQEKRYNLGLSHGIPSIINYLSRLYVFEDFKRETDTMLRGGINYILSVYNDNFNGFSLFPNWVKKGGSPKKLQKSRLAWCYGDLGIGMSLWMTSKALQDSVLGNTALTILKHAAKRTSPEDTLVVDAGICHGSYGIAQIFNRMFKETGVVECKEAALFWIEDGLKKATYKEGYAGYKQWAGNEKKWMPELSLLEGISGIGLAMMSYLSEDHDMMDWDECLMIS